MRVPPVYGWCVGQVARSLVRKMEAGECRAQEPHTHASTEIEERSQLTEKLQLCL